MADAPAPLTAEFARVMQSRKSDFVDAAETTTIAQHGAATLDLGAWPGWPQDLSLDEPVIETFVAGATKVQPMSDNEPFVSNWTPVVEWINRSVRDALGEFQVELDGDAYVTASVTPVGLLEGMAHMDDDTFTPTESVSMVAIIGEFVGPRIATVPLEPAPLRPMSQVIWSDEQLAAFEADEIDHCTCDGDQLVVFPQFGQLHAGPAAHHLQTETMSRRLLVYRAKVKPVMDSAH